MTTSDRLVRAFGGGAIAMGSLALLGWALGNRVLTSVVPGLTPMNPATAVCFVLGGMALQLLRESACSPVRRRVARALGAVLAVVGTTRIVAYLGGPDLMLDQLLFAQRLADFHLVANRMAPTTASCFVLAGAALAILDVGAGTARCPAQIVALAAMVPSLFTITGYAYGRDEMISLPRYIPMALNTATAFFLLSSGVLLARPTRGVVAAFMGSGPGGVSGRRLLFLAVPLPFLLGYVRLWGQRAGLYETELGVALTIVITVGLLVSIVWWNTRELTVAHEAQRAADAALAERTRQLEAANAELESFSYSVSHDLRAPLRAIDGFARILQTDHAPQLDDEAQRLLGIVCDNSRQMGRLIDDLLAFSRVGRQALERLPVDLQALVQSVVDDARRRDPLFGVTVEVGALPTILGDASLLRQVFVNLVSNGCKFSRNRPDARVEIGCTPGDGEVVCWVRDNGVGFDMQYAAKLFQVFQRLHRMEDFEGTGVGLAIVQRIVQRHGGRVWADGRVGDGATISCAFPTMEERGSDDDPRSGAPAGGGQSIGRGADDHGAEAPSSREQAPPRS